MQGRRAELEERKNGFGGKEGKNIHFFPPFPMDDQEVKTPPSTPKSWSQQATPTNRKMILGWLVHTR